MNSIGSTFKLNDQFTWEPMPDGSILYCQASGQIMTINPITELILSYCDGQTSIGEVLKAVKEDADLSEQEFETAVEKLVAEKVLLPA